MEDDFESLGIRSRDSLVFSLCDFITHGQRFDDVLAKTRTWAQTDKYAFPVLARTRKGTVSKQIENSACIKWIGEAGLQVVNASVSRSLPRSIRTRTEVLQAKCHGWMYPKSNRPILRKMDLDWAITEARSILRLIDKHHESRSSSSQV